MPALFFLPEILASDTLVVDGDEAHHALKVLRLTLGDELQVSDGRGNWAQGTITSLDKKSLTLSVFDRGNAERIDPELIVIQALTKSDRAKETIELLVEAGVDRIIPWQSDRCISRWKGDMHQKWESSVVTACKQSRRYHLPIVEQPISMKAIRERFTSDALLLVLHESASEKLSSVVTPAELTNRQIVLVVGPEGGISSDELRELSAMGGKVVRLGNPILRSAHAGIAGLAALQALLKRW